LPDQAEGRFSFAAQPVRFPANPAADLLFDLDQNGHRIHALAPVAKG